MNMSTSTATAFGFSRGRRMVEANPSASVETIAAEARDTFRAHEDDMIPTAHVDCYYQGLRNGAEHACTLIAARRAIRVHDGTDSGAAAWRLVERNGRLFASFESTRGKWQERGVVRAVGGGMTLVEITSDGLVHSCACGRCPRPAIR